MTAPLTPADCDLRGLPFMPLDTVRLVDSDLMALSTGEEFKASVTLWCKCWLQVPAASLPDDDRILAHLSGAGARWKKIKDMALRGFVLCDDGRWYHPVVAEKAREAWKHRLQQRARAAKRWDKRDGDAGDADVDEPGNADTGTDGKAPADATAPPAAHAVASPPDMQGTGRGTVKGKEEDPEAIASAAGAANDTPPNPPPNPLDLKKALFEAGIPLLMATGLNRDRSAAMLGKWRKTFTDGAVLDALTAAHTEAASDPIPFITRTLEMRNANRPRFGDRPSAWAPRSGSRGLEPASLDD